jgi:hypothetical protein
MFKARLKKEHKSQKMGYYLRRGKKRIRKDGEKSK